MWFTDPINSGSQKVEIVITSPRKTIYYMKKKTVRAKKVKMCSLYLISTGRCRDWEGGVEKKPNQDIMGLRAVENSLPSAQF